MATTGHVHWVTAEHVDQSWLDLSLKTSIFHSQNGCTSSTCGPLVNATNQIITSNKSDSTGQNPQHLLQEDFKWWLQVRRPRKNCGDWQVNVWQQATVQLWTCFRGPVGVWNGRVRYWENSCFSPSRSPTRDLGNQTSARVRWTCYCDYFRQVLTILELEQCRLQPPDGQPLGKFHWPLYWSTQQHHRGPLKPMNGTKKAKLPGYLDEFTWTKNVGNNSYDYYHIWLSI